jgi:hypothetical protein
LPFSAGAYEVSAWQNFFETSAGAAAALGGLIFVSVSMNLAEILAQEKKIGSSYLTGRALESLTALLVVMGVSLIGLDPSIGRVAFAVVILVSAAGSTVSPFRAWAAYRSSHVKPIAYSLRMFLALSLVVGYAASGGTLIAQAGGGLHWLLFAFLLAVVIAATNAWILLVEVLR